MSSRTVRECRPIALHGQSHGDQGLADVGMCNERLRSGPNDDAAHGVAAGFMRDSINDLCEFGTPNRGGAAGRPHSPGPLHDRRDRLVEPIEHAEPLPVERGCVREVSHDVVLSIAAQLAPVNGVRPQVVERRGERFVILNGNSAAADGQVLLQHAIGGVDNHRHAEGLRFQRGQ